MSAPFTRRFAARVVRVVRAVLAVAFVAFACGCPGEGAGGRAPVETCEEIGERCALQGGKVGICTGTPAGDLECVPQH